MPILVRYTRTYTYATRYSTSTITPADIYTATHLHPMLPNYCCRVTGTATATQVNFYSYSYTNTATLLHLHS
jgi:hypothetical protein